MTYYMSRGILIIIPVVAVVYMGLLYLFVVSTFFLASFVDPGIYPRGKPTLSLSLLLLSMCISCSVPRNICRQDGQLTWKQVCDLGWIKVHMYGIGLN